MQSGRWGEGVGDSGSGVSVSTTRASSTRQLVRLSLIYHRKDTPTRAHCILQQDFVLRSRVRNSSSSSIAARRTAAKRRSSSRDQSVCHRVIRDGINGQPRDGQVARRQSRRKERFQGVPDWPSASTGKRLHHKIRDIE